MDISLGINEENSGPLPERPVTTINVDHSDRMTEQNNIAL